MKSEMYSSVFVYILLTGNLCIIYLKIPKMLQNGIGNQVVLGFVIKIIAKIC